VYSCNALSARFFDVDRALNSYFMIMILWLWSILSSHSRVSLSNNSSVRHEYFTFHKVV